ncbi:glycosyltransferase [Enterobacter roggenkampii]|uniref:glycosyltransferase n=1 Tax=Enterobacter roggenkampii TaxID=1812935 RepID=UPI001C709FA8|nr:glycosyltransferase [Enterobacter roggenkampii]MBW9393706.1 glycosyltransferase [Enterobacter roggenkampii]
MNKVAVIMSLYLKDEPKQVDLAIKSILSQSVVDFDLFLYCDGPISVELARLIHEFSINYCNVYLFKSDENKGLAHALNFLIDRVVELELYDYIARMDGDDISYPDRLYFQVSFLTQHADIDVCGTSCREFGSEFALNKKHLPKSHSDLINFSISRCPFIHPTVMFRTSVFKSGIRYPENTDLTEDMALWFKLLEFGFKFSNLNEILLDYRISDDTINRRRGGGKAISELKIRIKYMFILKKISLLNFILVIAKFFFHLLPPVLMKLAYKFAR